MSDIRRLLESLDSIAEAGPKGIRDPYQELEGGKGFGGMGGGGGGGALSVWRSGRTGGPMQIPVAPSAARAPATAGKGLPKIERLPGETPAQAIARAQSAQAAVPLPQGVTPSTAGAGQGGRSSGPLGPLGQVSPGEPAARGPLGPLEKSSVLRTNPERGLGRMRQPTDPEYRAAEKIVAQNKLRNKPEQFKKLISPALVPATAIDLGGGGGGGAGQPGQMGKAGTSTQGAETPTADSGSPQASNVEIWRPEEVSKTPTTAADIAVDTSANAAPKTSAVASAPKPSTPASAPAVKPQPAKAAEKPSAAASKPSKPAEKPVAEIPPEPTAAQLSRIYPQQPAPIPATTAGTPSAVTAPRVPQDTSTRSADSGTGAGTGQAASQSQIDALRRMSGGNLSGGMGQGTGAGPGTGTGSGAGTGSGTGTGRGSGAGSGAGPGQGPGTGEHPTSYDPLQMLRYKAGRTDENSKVNKLVKEFKKFVTRVK